MILAGRRWGPGSVTEPRLRASAGVVEQASVKEGGKVSEVSSDAEDADVQLLTTAESEDLLRIRHSVRLDPHAIWATCICG